MAAIPPFEEEDRWSSLLERFVARGANIRIGAIHVDMMEHLLNAVEELEQNVRGVEDAYRKQRKDGEV
jgi:hypothetical protein